MKLERFNPNSAGLKELLESEEMRAMLHAKAELAATAARARNQMMSSPRESAEGGGKKKRKKGQKKPPVPMPIEVDSQAGAPRARAAIIASHPGSLAAEKKNRILGSSIGAMK